MTSRRHPSASLSLLKVKGVAGAVRDKRQRTTVTVEPFEIDDAQAEAFMNAVGDETVERLAPKETA